VKTPLFIATADWHLTTRSVLCRTDDLVHTITNKLSKIASVAANLHIPIIAAGDLTDRYIESPEVLSTVYRVFQNRVSVNVLFVYGQHDVPNHNVKEASKGCTHLLKEVGALHLLGSDGTSTKLPCVEYYGASWGARIPRPKNKHTTNVLVLHKTVWSSQNKKSAFHGVTDNMSVEHLITQEPYCLYDVIVSGDNHSHFVVTNKNKQVRTKQTVWLNCGPIMRLNAGEATLVPKYHIVSWDDKQKTISIESVELPHAELSLNHLADKAFEKSMGVFSDSFVTSLSDGIDKSVSFKQVLSALVENGNLKKRTRRMIWQAYEKAVSCKR
jgi:DNA repair exonuclease SbcCD nuclease subunit